jgi:putative inorganic carbon (hco3(-)) transporter
MIARALLTFARWSLYVTLAALPLYTVRWSYGPLPTTLLETLILVTVAAYVGARLREGRWRPVATPFDIPIVVLLAAGAVSVAVASDHRSALGLYRAYFVEPVALFYVAADLLKREEQVRRLLLAFAIGSSAFALLNLGAFLQAVAAHHVLVGAAPNALYGDANYVAMYMEPPFALGAALLMLSRSWTWRVVGGAWMLITGSALVLTFSKGGYLALIALVALVILTVPRWRVALVAVLMAGVLAATQVPLLVARMATISSSLDGRLQVFADAFDVIRHHPVLGVGLAGYTYSFRGAMSEIYPHNIWLTFWVEVGIVGLAAFATVFLGAQWLGWRRWPNTEGFYRVALWGALAALVMWFTHGLVDSPYWKNDMSVEFWILVALVTVARRTEVGRLEKLEVVRGAVVADRPLAAVR